MKNRFMPGMVARVRRHGLLTLLLIFGGAPPALAGPSTGIDQVTGQVLSRCTLSQLAPIVLSTTVPANGKLDPTLEGRNWTIANVNCNSPTRIAVSAKALRRNVPRTSLTPSQSQTINFTASATGWSPAAATVTTGETTPLGTGATYNGTPRVQSQAKSAAITVTVSGFIAVTAQSNSAAKPVDGAYSATITIAIVPNV